MIRFQFSLSRLLAAMTLAALAAWLWSFAEDDPVASWLTIVAAGAAVGQLFKRSQFNRTTLLWLILALAPLLTGWAALGAPDRRTIFVFDGEMKRGYVWEYRLRITVSRDGFSIPSVKTGVGASRWR
jgi:hypothetical protein